MMICDTYKAIIRKVNLEATVKNVFLCYVFFQINYISLIAFYAGAPLFAHLLNLFDRSVVGS